MKHYLLLFVFCLSLNTFAQKSTVIISPDTLNVADDPRLKIFLGGSIDMGNAINWQKEVEKSFANEDVILLNPRRGDWKPDWQPISSDLNFRRQVEWELDALEKADIIIMYLMPNTQSPISLLELGLFARSDKLRVICPEGFWRKGNVDIVCEKYGIKTFGSIEELIESL
jgi:hypothetical protein